MNIVKTNLQYKNPLIPLNLNKVLFLIVHHVEAVKASPEDIHKWHLKNGWNGFGYNEYIRKDGTVYIGRGDNIGAQCANMNSKSYGIACEGNYNTETNMPQAQYNSLVERLKYHKNRLPNFIKISPHSEFFNTSCPGQYINMEKIINAVNNGQETELINSIQVLQQNGILGDPKYWLGHAIPGCLVQGEFAAILINNTAKVLK
jgi:N-acetylmuramoyl-L-alanine amidase